MRRLLAALLALVGLLAVALGIGFAVSTGQPGTTTATTSLSSPGAAVSTVPGLLALAGSPVTVAARAHGKPIFLGVARDADARAWLGNVRHTELTDLAGSRLTSRVAGSQPKAADPRQADIWVASSSGTGAATLQWPDRPGRWVLVVAQDGATMAPLTITSRWPATHTAGWFVGLAVAGAVLAVGGLGLWMGRPGRRPGRGGRRALPAAALVLLAGCGGPQLQPDAVPSGPQPVVEQPQGDRVLTAAAADRTAADRGYDEALLARRAVGPALTAGLAAYKVGRVLDPQHSKTVPTMLTGGRLIVPRITGWPRFLAATVPGGPGAPPSLVILVSASAREPYRVWARPSLLPGSALPATAPASQGATVVPIADGAGLVTAPAKALTDYAALLSDSAPPPASAGEFEPDTFRTDVTQAEAKEKAALAAVADVTHAHAVQPGAFAWRTSDGGVVVVGVLAKTVTITVRAGAVTLAPDYAALAGAAQFGKTAQATVLEVVALQVPRAGHGKVRAVAASEHLVAVTGS